MTRTIKVQKLHPLKSYTTLKVGGLARFFCEVSSISEYLEVLELSKKESLPIFVLGKGSNTLFIDDIFEAIVVLNKINHLDLDLPRLKVGSGYHISLLSTKVSKKGFSGLEGASGIPATVGGAVYMNAGSGHWETFGSLVSVTSVDPRGHIITRFKKDIEHSYRHTMYQNLNEFIVDAEFELKFSEATWNTQQNIIKKRIATQPYKDHSAGCFFKNPEGFSAGALIDKAGLKGTYFNEAGVSCVHANFLINKGHAQPKDLLELAKIIEDKVFETSGIKLEREVRLVGNYLYEKV
jgi:UDP-N-acetylmuramate dehydrogenase